MPQHVPEEKSLQTEQRVQWQKWAVPGICEGRHFYGLSFQVKTPTVTLREEGQSEDIKVASNIPPVFLMQNTQGTTAELTLSLNYEAGTESSCPDTASLIVPQVVAKVREQTILLLRRPRNACASPKRHTTVPKTNLLPFLQASQAASGQYFPGIVVDNGAWTSAAEYSIPVRAKDDLFHSTDAIGRTLGVTLTKNNAGQRDDHRVGDIAVTLDQGNKRENMECSVSPTVNVRTFDAG